MRQIQNTRASDVVKFLGRCPACDRRYTLPCVTVMRRARAFTVAHVECPRCRTSVIARVASWGTGVVTTLGMMTDLEQQEVARFARLSPVTHDDVLNLHMYFSNVGDGHNIERPNTPGARSKG